MSTSTRDVTAFTCSDKAKEDYGSAVHRINIYVTNTEDNYRAVGRNQNRPKK